MEEETKIKEARALEIEKKRSELVEEETSEESAEALRRLQLKRGSEPQPLQPKRHLLRSPRPRKLN